MAPPEPFALKDGDRVVWLGGTFVEREQSYGRFEEFLQLAQSRSRNLVIPQSRPGAATRFGAKPAQCSTASQGVSNGSIALVESKPTVIVLAYGSNESFAGEAGLTKFREAVDENY